MELIEPTFTYQLLSFKNYIDKFFVHQFVTEMPLDYFV